MMLENASLTSNAGIAGEVGDQLLDVCPVDQATLTATSPRHCGWWPGDLARVQRGAELPSVSSRPADQACAGSPQHSGFA
jgi:hypothetical protein